MYHMRPLRAGQLPTQGGRWVQGPERSGLAQGAGPRRGRGAWARSARSYVVCFAAVAAAVLCYRDEVQAGKVTYVHSAHTRVYSTHLRL